jgi:hypothetical protein
MDPFQPFVNIDGLKNAYTDYLYEFAPRPTCTTASPDCGSRYVSYVSAIAYAVISSIFDTLIFTIYEKVNTKGSVYFQLLIL